MNYTFGMGVWNSVFAVPTALTDRHLKLAGKAHLKVILWVLRHAGAVFTMEQMSEALGLSREETEEAMAYWVEAGLLAQTDARYAPGIFAGEASVPGHSLQETAVPGAVVRKVPVQEPLAQENAAGGGHPAGVPPAGMDAAPKRENLLQTHPETDLEHLSEKFRTAESGSEGQDTGESRPEAVKTGETGIYGSQTGLNPALAWAGEPEGSGKRLSVSAEKAGQPEKSEKPGKRHRPKPDGIYLAARLKESESLRILMQEAENTLGKTLSPAYSSALLMVHEDYGIPAEVILMMVQYACGIGKTGTVYLEALAKDWMESEIFTIEAAEEKLKALDERRQAWKTLASILGIYHRSATKKEEAYAFTWLKEWKLQKALIGEAYERCADHTGKLSLSYMNRILERWHHSGVGNLADVAAMDAAKKKTQEKTRSYDLDELASLPSFHPVEG